MGRFQLLEADGQLSKEDQINEYLKQDNAYWLNNDKWDSIEDIFFGKILRNKRYYDFSNLKSNRYKNEVKFYFLYHFKEELLKYNSLSVMGSALSHLSNCINVNTLLDINIDRTNIKWKLYLINHGIKYKGKTNSNYFAFINNLLNFIHDFYDDRDETDKDIWDIKNIQGAKIPASGLSNPTLNFLSIPQYYRNDVKNYLKTIITKRSASHCFQNLRRIKYFIKSFYSRGYLDGFIEQLNRQDIEDYLYHLNNEFKDNNPTYRSKFVSYVRTFLEYIQLAQYEKAPKKEVSFLIFQDDIPRRELNKDEVKKAKFIPEPVVKQIDNNIRDLDRPQYIPFYILLRETGWRGTDILNLRHNNCLKRFWNKKEEKYNNQLCGDITKTGIANLKIPIRDQVAEMLDSCIKKTKKKSDDNNNPKKYLFNMYKGSRKTRPLSLQVFANSIRRLIKEKDIRDHNGEIYHFTPHQLRHTRAKEYIEQGIGISIIQQILGHTSLQMTIHYAKISENKLYEKWKKTKDLDLFKVETNIENKQINPVAKAKENLIRYEYIKENLDAVKVPFGMCFKPSKLPCKKQLNHCLNCASFCTSVENIPEYEAEILKVKEQIMRSKKNGKDLWIEKNREYLKLLEKMLIKIREEKIVHKNARSREVQSNG
ncbi:tyrosine-type recombinase/integrase [Natronospora cellulosivora (SeqCode)]